ncbi:hypothetical protein Hanom_Chr05g00393201 [Helianthus anomalus]
MDKGRRVLKKLGLNQNPAKDAHEEKCSKIKAVHFEKVLKKIKPSVSDKERGHYDLMAKILEC